MNKKMFYVAPAVEEMELMQEGVLCTSGGVGQIDPLKDGEDLSGMWDN